MEEKGQALAREGGIERHEGAAGSENGEQDDDPVERPAQADSHRHLGAHPEGREADRQPAGLPVELAVGERRRPGDQGHGIRGAPRLLQEQLVDGALPRVVRRSPAPLGELMALGGGEEGQVPQPPLRRRRGAREELTEALREALDRRRREEVGAVLPDPGQPLGGGGEIQRQVELRRLPVELQPRELEPGQGEGPPRRVLEGEEDLEDGRPARVPLGGHRFDDLLEGQVLMRIGREGRPPHSRKELPELGIAAQIRTQDKGVDEEPDQPLALAAGAVGDRRSHRQVFLPRDPRQESGEAGEESHEQGSPGAPGEPGQGLGALGPENERAHGSPARPLPGPRVVGREVQGRQAGQGLPPPGDLPFEHRTREPLPLPDGEIRILDRQCRQDLYRRGVSGQEGAVERSQLLDQHSHRPAVGDDVVQVEERPLPLPPDTDQHRPQERPVGEVERPAGLLPGQPGQLRPPRRLRNTREVDLGHLQRILGADGALGSDHLYRPAAGPGEGRPQRFVPADDRRQAGDERRPVQPARELERRRHVVSRASRLQLV